MFIVPKEILHNTVALATDIDDTLTIGGRIPSKNLDYISKLRGAGISVILVTGRTAGHGLALSTYLDINAAIVENGGAICVGESAKLTAGFGPATLDRLENVVESVRKQFPMARPTEDNFMRLSDRAFHVGDFSQEDIAHVREIATQSGLDIVCSSIHLHIRDPKTSKGKTLISHLKSNGVSDMRQVITIGDSPNDESIFDTSHFPNSVAVKNVEKHLNFLQKKPRYILTEYEGHGFGALAAALLEARR